jgi:hypothetical protein
MSRLKTALKTMRAIAASVVDSPQCTLQAIKYLPTVARGLHFSRTAPFSQPPARPVAISYETNPLRAYFDAHTTGHGIWKWLHYFDIYHRHFQKFVGREVHVLEIGIYSGGSLEMWRNYFGPACHIYGVDIAPACKSYEAENIRVFIGDQADRHFWREFKKTVPRVDILIDDGGHDPDQQRITLEEMLPHLQPGGVFLCEDSNKFFSCYNSSLACELNTVQREHDIFDAPVTPTPLQASVKSIIQYPFVNVIEKNEYHPGLFISQKKGTQWQPY